MTDLMPNKPTPQLARLVERERIKRDIAPMLRYIRKIGHSLTARQIEAAIDDIGDWENEGGRGK